ncbi:hypothetical protein ABKW28_10765 [Nocardioides sp. 31GB23]|uniref:hypothetical protein n=1 Tax=Nocardioides sp. 31GB23 TaxID=3156065 RepID=UPI0032AF30D8
MTEKTRKNLGMLVLSVPIIALGLLITQASGPIGSLVVLFAGVVALVSILEIGLELLRSGD